MTPIGASLSECCPSQASSTNSKTGSTNGSNTNNQNDHELMSRLGCCGCRCCAGDCEVSSQQRPLSEGHAHHPRCVVRKTASLIKPLQLPPPPLRPKNYVSLPRRLLPKTALSNLLLTYCFFILIVSTLVKPSLTSVNSYYQNALVTSQQNNKNSGQYHISQLCSQRSPFPITRRVEGATLSAGPQDTDLNCTVTFRTKSAQQHFVIRFEELKLSCDDHLILFDGDLDYGQPSIKDFSCRDNMASVPIIKTTGTFLTMRYSSDGVSKLSDGFRLVVTAVFDISMSDCPPEYVFCRSQLCISRSLFCDGVNHCLDNSDEVGCNGPDDAIELPYALGFFVMLVLFISAGVIVCIILHCRRDNSPYDHYQHQLQRTFGVPLQTSSSLMFAHHQNQPQYQFFQPANVSPYMTPHHMPSGSAAANAQQLFATLPRGYSTLPLNLVRGQPQQAQAILASKAVAAANANAQDSAMLTNHNQPQEYLMMAGLNGPHLVHPGSFTLAAMQAPQVTSGNVQQQQHHARNLTNSQSILSTTTAAAVGPSRLVQQRAVMATPPSASNGGQTNEGPVGNGGGTLRQRTGSGQ